MTDKKQLSNNDIRPGTLGQPKTTKDNILRTIFCMNLNVSLLKTILLITIQNRKWNLLRKYIF